MRKTTCSICGKERDGAHQSYCNPCIKTIRKPPNHRDTCKTCGEKKDGKHPTYCNKCRKIIRKKSYSNMSPERRESRLKEMSEYMKKTRPERKEKIKAYERKLHHRRKKDPIYNLHQRVSRSIQHISNGIGVKKKDRTLKYIGATISEFKEHIESQFTEGMTWENRGEWQLDHIVPKSLAKTEKDVYTVSQLKNWQPLWNEDNLKKSNHVDYSHPMTSVILSELDS